MSTQGLPEINVVESLVGPKARMLCMLECPRYSINATPNFPHFKNTFCSGSASEQPPPVGTPVPAGEGAPVGVACKQEATDHGDS